MFPISWEYISLSNIQKSFSIQLLFIGRNTEHILFTTKTDRPTVAVGLMCRMCFPIYPKKFQIWNFLFENTQKV